MKLLCFSDIHGDIKSLKRIVLYSKNVDLVICAGDFTDFGSKIKGILKMLNASRARVLIIPGNHEEPKTLERLCSSFKNISYFHKKHEIINNMLFIGYGTGGFAIRDPEFVNFAGKLKNVLLKNKKMFKILITHAPPFDSGIDFIDDAERMPLGNKDIRNFLLKNKIDVCISGHFHETAGIFGYLGNTLVINPGEFFVLEV
ncbi:MAG: metallophosphoesterase family protein [Candidatus Woesearchaeota archaeon]